MSIKNKILITGASSGVGKTLTNYLAGNYHVIAVARRLDRLKEYFGKNENVSIYNLDLAKSDSLESFCERIIEDHGYILNLINNAGVNINGDITENKMSDFRYSMEVNGFAPLFLMKFFLKGMRENNFGRIINITSGAPLNCFKGFGAYSSSKSFLNAITVTAAKENAKNNIKINLMSPGPVKTEMAPDAELEPDICHPMTKYLLNIDENGPTGKFYWLKYEVPLFPDLEGVQWIEGKGNEKLNVVLP